MTLAVLQHRYKGAEAFHFGDREALCERLNALIANGKKTATCDAFANYDPENLPAAGAYAIALHWDDRPAFVIKLTQVTTERFCDVSEEHALAEGENEDWAGWARDHKNYFERNGGWSEDMRLLCVRFKLVEVIS